MCSLLIEVTPLALSLPISQLSLSELSKYYFKHIHTSTGICIRLHKLYFDSTIASFAIEWDDLCCCSVRSSENRFNRSTVCIDKYLPNYTKTIEIKYNNNQSVCRL